MSCEQHAASLRWLSIRLLSMLILLAGAVFAQKAPSPLPAGNETSPAPRSSTPTQSKFHEDWSSISLESSTLMPPTAVLGQQDDVPEGKYVRELWQVSWRPGDALDLYVIRPKGVTKPPAILFLYSFPTNTDRFKDDHWCAGVTSGGYAAIGFVSALTGHRLENRAPKEWFVSELPESLATSAHDVQMVLNFLAARGEFDMDHIAMFGEGSGGSIAILAAAADQRIKAIQVMDSWGDWPKWLAESKLVPDDQRQKYLKPEFLKQLASLDPIVWLPKVKAQGVRIQNVRPNPRVPEDIQKSLEAAAPEQAEIEQFGDARAFLNVAMTGGKAFSWLKDQIQPNAKPLRAADKSDRVHYYPPAVPPPGPMDAPVPAVSGAGQNKP